MNEISKETPVTYGMLLDALDGCGLAVGFALAGTLNTSGTERRLILGRLGALFRLKEGPRPRAVILPAEALLRRVIPRADLGARR